MFLSKLYSLHGSALISWPSVFTWSAGEAMLPLCAGEEECSSENERLGRKPCKAQYSASAELAVNEDEHFRGTAHRFLQCVRHCWL